MVNTRRGLHQLYARFGTEEFTGDALRSVMIEVMGSASQPRVGWVASTHLGRLVKSGVVARVWEDPEAKAAWAHRYQLTPKGLDHVGANVARVDDGPEYDEDNDPVVLSINDAREMMRRMVPRKRHRVSKATASITPGSDHEHRWNGLRIALVSGWIELSVSITSEGQEWLAQEEGKL